MEHAYSLPDNVIYFEVSQGKGLVKCNDRATHFYPPTIDLVLHAIDVVVHPFLGKHREFYVKPKDDEETRRIPVLAQEEQRYVTLEGRTLKLAGGKVPLDH